MMRLACAVLGLWACSPVDAGPKKAVCELHLFGEPDPDPYRGEAVKAFITLRPGATATADEVIEFCRASLAKYKVPTLVEFMPSLPKSAVGKVLRRELREMESQRQK